LKRRFLKVLKTKLKKSSFHKKKKELFRLFKTIFLQQKNSLTCKEKQKNDRLPFGKLNDKFKDKLCVDRKQVRL
jgi:hypothetical protein